MTIMERIDRVEGKVDRVEERIGPIGGVMYTSISSLKTFIESSTTRTAQKAKFDEVVMLNCCFVMVNCQSNIINSLYDVNEL